MNPVGDVLFLELLVGWAMAGQGTWNYILDHSSDVPLVLYAVKPLCADQF